MFSNPYRACRGMDEVGVTYLNKDLVQLKYSKGLPQT